MAETWKPVPGFTGYYEVSDQGRVRSLDRQVIQLSAWGKLIARKYRGRILAPAPDKDGYLSVVLSFQSGKVMRRIHQLVLETFVGDCPPGMQACHNDDDPANNRLANLRWDTPKGNHADMLRRGTHARGERQGSAKLTRNDVQMILNSKTPAKEIAREYGIHWSHVYKIRSRKKWGWYNAAGA